MINTVSVQPTPTQKKVWLSWSSGKDSAWTFYQLQQDPEINLAGIFTTINQHRNRVAMHATRYSLLQAQADQMQIPLHIINIPEPCDNPTYEAVMLKLLQEAQQANVTDIAFGDLFLEDIRQYRINNLKATNINPIFPLWQQPTKELALTMIANGLKAIITCVDSKQLPAEFVGREFDTQLIDDLPDTVDPCGENGEFHTFVYAAPMFKEPLQCERGRHHQSGQFHFIDLKLRSMRD